MTDDSSRLRNTAVRVNSEQATQESHTETQNRSQTQSETEPKQARPTCPECDGTVVTDENGDKVCDECGLVVNTDQIDYGPEWTYADDSEAKERRVGAPLTETIHDRGLSTQIGQYQDAKGNNLTSKKKAKMNRLRVWNEQTQSSRKRNLRHALSEIDRMIASLGLPENVQETASVIYRRAANEDLLPGHSIEGIAAAAIYAAARKANYPRIFREFKPVTRVDIDRVKRSYKYLDRELNLKVEPINPIELIPQYISELSVTHNVEETAKEILTQTRSTHVHSGRHPAGLAAASIYLASLTEHEHITQREISDVSDISTMTIRETYKALGSEYLTKSHPLADRVDL